MNNYVILAALLAIPIPYPIRAMDTIEIITPTTVRLTDTTIAPINIPKKPNKVNTTPNKTLKKDILL